MRRGQSPTPKETREKIRRMLAIYMSVHPKRIAARYGFAPTYVYRQWRLITKAQLDAAVLEAEQIAEHMRNGPQLGP